MDKRNLLFFLSHTHTIWWQKDKLWLITIEKKKTAIPFFTALGHKPIYVANEIMSRGGANTQQQARIGKRDWAVAWMGAWKRAYSNYENL